MNLHDATRWRNILGKAGALFCAIFLVAAVDGLMQRFRHPHNFFQLLPGQTVEVNGPMKEDSRDLSALTYAGSSKLIELSFEELQTGFWLGGNMWRGSLKVSSHAQPGEYSLRVAPKDDFSQKPLAIFSIKVYSDDQSLNKDSKSLFRRHIGVSPWWMMACFLPLTAAAFGAVFLLSQKRANLLAERGMAEVYRVFKVDGGNEIAFGLGSRQGVEPGMSLLLMDEDGVVLGNIKAGEILDNDSTALIDVNLPVKHGYLVSLEK